MTNRNRLITGGLLAASLLAGCSVGASAPTATPYPTYTPYPTFTPPPTATATFIPSPTAVPPTETPLPTATGDGDGEAAAASTQPTASSPSGVAGIPAVMAFETNLRDGPGTSFPANGFVYQDEQVLILGRNVQGSWMFIRDSTNREGWVRVTQFKGVLDVAAVPLAETIPTPGATATPETAPTTAVSVLAGRVTLEVAPGATACQPLTWGAPHPFPVDGPDQTFVLFDPLQAASRTGGVRAYKLTHDGVPVFLTVSVNGNPLAQGCVENGTACTLASFSLCATARGDAPVGDYPYEHTLTLSLGTQSFDAFYKDVSLSIPTTLRVVSP